MFLLVISIPWNMLFSFTSYISVSLFLFPVKNTKLAEPYEAGLKSCLTLILINVELCLQFLIFRKDPKYI